MNIKELIKTQQKLDAAMFEKAGITKYPSDDMLLAYKVEVGEALNAWSGFKYWKDNKSFNRDAILEELADCLHFALSLEGYYDEFYDYRYKEYEGREPWEYLQRRMGMGRVGVNYYAENCFKNDEYVGNTIALALSMGFTREELVDAYYKKNKKNYERIAGGY